MLPRLGRRHWRPNWARPGPTGDSDLVAAVQALTSLVDSQAGKYTVNMRGAEGVQIGDYHKQEHFRASPGGRGE